MMLTDNLKTDHIWCVLPVFNNRDTVKKIVSGCRNYLHNIIVVDDGSTDFDFSILDNKDVTVLKHARNQGKGKAIITALDHIRKKDGKFMITIDADGQHNPEDLKKFITLLQDDDSKILIGSRNFSIKNVPAKSRFGRKFANFWLRLESGASIDDCQSGFRAYPIKHLPHLNLKGKRYDFETEVLAKGAWAGLKLATVPISTFYESKEKRISHYRPFLDTLRISFMHTKLVLRRLLPWPHKRLISDQQTYFDFDMFYHPLAFIKKLLRQETTPLGLAFAAAVGVFLATLPIISLHTLAIIYVTSRLHLNKIMAVTIQHICIPPFVPIACIQLGHYLLYGKLIKVVSFEVIFAQLGDRLFEWFIGSLIIAPVLSIIVGVVVFLISNRLQRNRLSLQNEI